MDGVLTVKPTYYGVQSWNDSSGIFPEVNWLLQFCYGLFCTVRDECCFPGELAEKFEWMIGCVPLTCSDGIKMLLLEPLLQDGSFFFSFILQFTEICSDLIDKLIFYGAYLIELCR